MVKFQFLQFETRTVNYKILIGMIKIVVLRSAFNEIILISPNTKGEKVVFFDTTECQITAGLQSASAILLFIYLQYLKTAPVSVVFHKELP